MTERPTLSRAELEIARVLWSLGEAGVRAVHDALPDRRQHDFTTVQTYLRRLESKGYVSSRLEGRVRIYKPKIKPRTVIRDTVEELVDRLFAGESLPLMKHLLEERPLSDAEIAELRQLLDEQSAK